MKVIGLTGGFASGKSLAASILRSLGATVLSADELAHQIEAPGTDAFQEIVQAFGPGMVRADGTLDRKRLAELIFRDPTARARLNAITHPRIRQALGAKIDRLRATKDQGPAVVEIPLLLDTAARDLFPLDGVIVVSVDAETQIARLMARDRLTREAALQRLQAQRPLAEKVSEADWVIENSGTEEQTRRQVETLWERLRSRPEGDRWTGSTTR